MVSYYNPLAAMYPKSHCANLYPGANPWYPSNYQPSNAQLFAAAGASSAGSSVDADGQPAMYYPPHMFHQSASPDWHDSFSTPPSVNGGLLQAPSGGTPTSAGHHHHHLHHHHHNPNQQSHGGGGLGGPGGSGSGGGGGASEHLNDGLHSIPSPPITVSGSEMSSPGGGVNAGTSSHNGLLLHNGPGSASPHHQMSMRPVPVKSPFEWIKRTSYQNQTNPGE